MSKQYIGKRKICQEQMYKVKSKEFVMGKKKTKRVYSKEWTKWGVKYLKLKAD